MQTELWRKSSTSVKSGIEDRVLSFKIQTAELQKDSSVAINSLALELDIYSLAHHLCNV